MKHRKSHDIVFGESRHAGPGHLRSGFTLVIALVLMILLIILAVGLLSLAAIQLRQTSIAADHARARANARLAMQLAIGELQRTLGPDSRVSAPADALTVALGVVHADWQHTTAVLKHSEDALVPPNETPAAKIKREFIGWLVSGDPSHTSLPASAASAVPSALVLMKGATEMPDARAAPVSVLTAQTQGRYAWWVEDLGTKASMALPPQTDATLAILAPPRFDIPKIPDASAAPEKNSELWNALVTTGTSELVIPNAKAMIREAGRSVTALHRAVLADVAVGRLKRDLTVALEQTQATMETWLGQKIYDPVGNSGDPGGPHWEQLRQYYQSGTSGTLTVRRQTADQEGYYPVIAGLTEIYGISNTLGYAPSGAPVYAPNFYNKADANGIATSNVMAFHMSPVIKLWNPYDRPLKAPDGFTVAVTNGNSQHATSATDYDASYQDQIGWGRNGGIVVEVRPPKAMRYEHRYFIPATTIAPGETKIFCLTTNRFLDVDGTYLPFDATKDLGAKTNVTGNGWILGDLSDVTDSGGFTGHSFWDLNFTKLANVPLTDRERWNYTGGRAQQQPVTGGDIQILDTVTTTNLEFRVIPHPFTTWSVRLFAGRQRRPALNAGGTAYEADPEPPLVNIRNINTNTTGFSKPNLPILNNPNPTTEPFFLTTSGKPSIWARRVVLKLANNEGDGDPYLYNPQNGKTKDAKWLANYNPRSPTVGCSPKEHARPLVAASFSSDPLPPTNALRVNGSDNASPYGMGTPGNLLSGMLSSLTSEDALFLNKAIGYSDIAGPTATVLFQTPTPGNPEKYFFSIGQLTHANLWIQNGPYETDVKTKRHTTEDWFSDNLHPAYPIGNSYADPRLKLADNRGLYQNLTVVDQSNTYESTFHDISYYMNRSLWDAYFFSARKINEDAAGSYNSRFEFITPTALTGDEAGFRGNAEKLLLMGAFNINSTDPDAWIAFLSSLCDVTVGTGGPTTRNAAYPRVLPALSGEVNSTTAASQAAQYTGFRALSQAEVKQLAEKIVEQIKERGPATSLADFINRATSKGSPVEQQIKGALQAAIDATTINEKHQGAAKACTIVEGNVDSIYEEKSFAGDIVAAVPGYLTQADILTRLGQLTVPRSDTFLIRCRGDAFDASGKVVATATCEATVQRMPNYVDPAVDLKKTFKDLPANSPAKSFGRALILTGFRWVNPHEI